MVGYLHANVKDPHIFYANPVQGSAFYLRPITDPGLEMKTSNHVHFFLSELLNF